MLVCHISTCKITTIYLKCKKYPTFSLTICSNAVLTSWAMLMLSADYFYPYRACRPDVIWRDILNGAGAQKTTFVKQYSQKVRSHSPFFQQPKNNAPHTGTILWQH